LNDWRETSALAVPICEAKEGKDFDSNEFFRRARVFFLLHLLLLDLFGATASTDLKKLLPNKPRISSKLCFSIHSRSIRSNILTQGVILLCIAIVLSDIGDILDYIIALVVERVQ
jgi:hypothetical protein